MVSKHFTYKFYVQWAIIAILSGVTAVPGTAVAAGEGCEECTFAL
jgi:hypothetical protein